MFTEFRYSTFGQRCTSTYSCIDFLIKFKIMCHKVIVYVSVCTYEENCTEHLDKFM